MYSELGFIIVAGGSGTRFNGKNKLLEKINDIPLFLYSIKTALETCPEKNIVLVCNEDYLEEYKKNVALYCHDKIISFTTGGASRAESVFNGLKTINTNIKFVAVHDAARPLIDKEIIEKCYSSCIKSGSGVAAKKITDTVKLTDKSNRVLKTVDRNCLWSIETPQIFKFSDLKSAYSKVVKENISVTDDAGAIEYSGLNVYIVENLNPNIKVTYSDDLNYADYLLTKQYIKTSTEVKNGRRKK